MKLEFSRQILENTCIKFSLCSSVRRELLVDRGFVPLEMKACVSCINQCYTIQIIFHLTDQRYYPNLHNCKQPAQGAMPRCFAAVTRERWHAIERCMAWLFLETIHPALAPQLSIGRASLLLPLRVCMACYRVTCICMLECRNYKDGTADLHICT